MHYIEYYGDHVRHSICNYWYEDGAKFDGGVLNFDELGTKYNPEVIKYRPLSEQILLPAALRPAGGCIL